MVAVLMSNTVTVTDTGIGGGDGTGYIYGDPPIWEDDNDASYASVAIRCFGDGEPQFRGHASCDVDAAQMSFGTTVRRVQVRVRFRAELGTNVKMPDIVFRQNFAGGRVIQIAHGDDTRAPHDPTWFEFTMPMTDSDLDAFRSTPAWWTVQVYPGAYSSPVPNELQRIAIYEARVNALPLRRVAPPCQNFPRDDSGGAFPCQNYPPPKSHQGGRVNFGYW